MERTRDNLLRVQDVLHELDRQMGSLQRQAKRAEEYHRLKGALRELDMRVMAERRRTWTAEAVDAGAELGRLRDEEEGLHAQLSATREASDDARRRRHECEGRLRQAEGELTEQRVAATQAAARIAGLGARQRDLESRALEAEGEASLLRGRLSEVAAELVSLDDALERLARAQAEAEAERERSQSRLDELGSAGVPLEQGVEEAKDAVVGAGAEEARLQNLAEALHRRRAEIEGQRRQLEGEQRELGVRLEENERGRDALRQRLDGLETERASVESRRGALVESATALAADEARGAQACADARDRVTQLRSRIESLRELQARYEGCTRGVASLLGRDDERAARAGAPRARRRGGAGHATRPDRAARHDAGDRGDPLAQPGRRRQCHGDPARSGTAGNGDRPGGTAAGRADRGRSRSLGAGRGRAGPGAPGGRSRRGAPHLARGAASHHRGHAGG
jgi:chromosome segregation protein